MSYRSRFTDIFMCFLELKPPPLVAVIGYGFTL